MADSENDENSNKLLGKRNKFLNLFNVVFNPDLANGPYW